MEGQGPEGPCDGGIPDRSDFLLARELGALCVGVPI
jgi:hypothetical protein